jgi:hypothetical protein
MKNNQTRQQGAQSPQLGRLPTVETIVDQVLEIFRHGYLPHELVLVAVHAHQSTNVREYVGHPLAEIRQGC